MKQQFLGTNPILPVKSVIDTAKFFEKYLGFTIELLWENPSYGVVKRGNSVIEFGEARKDYAGSGICLIFVENADEVYNEWAENQVEFFGDLADRDYGNRDFRVKDNNGNLLIISQALKNQKELQQKGNVVSKGTL